MCSLITIDRGARVCRYCQKNLQKITSDTPFGLCRPAKISRLKMFVNTIYNVFLSFIIVVNAYERVSLNRIFRVQCIMSQKINGPCVRRQVAAEVGRSSASRRAAASRGTDKVFKPTSAIGAVRVSNKRPREITRVTVHRPTDRPTDNVRSNNTICGAM